MSSLVLLLGLVGPASAATHAPGDVIENAALVDIPPEGFEAIASSVAGLIPASFSIDEVAEGVTCFEFSLADAWVGIELVDTKITPQDGYLDVELTLNLQVNSEDDPFDMYLELICIGDSCDGYVKPFPVTVRTTLALDVVTGADGDPALDATVGDMEITYDLDTESDIDLGDCALQTFADVLDVFGLDLYGWVIGLVDGELDSALGDLGPELETTIEEAFSSAMIEEDLDLNGVALHVELYPSDVIIDTSGVRLAMNGGLSTSEASECIAEYDPGGSLATPSDPPDLGSAPDGVSRDYHAAALVSDDFANQGLYGAWRGGLLCYTLDADAGIPLDTSTVLGVLAGDAFDELFPESKPIVIQTRPRAAPTLGLDGERDVNVAVEQLGLELYSEVDGRLAQVLGLDLGVDAGVDLNLDGSTGALGLDVDLGTDSMDCAVNLNEFAPDADADIESQCAGALGTIASTALGSLLSDLSFSLPAFGAMGLTDMEVSAAGPSADWLGLYAWIGEVPYGSEDAGLGCDGGDTGGASGCESASSGCEGGGCSTGGRAMNRWLLLVVPLALAARRRRA